MISLLEISLKFSVTLIFNQIINFEDLSTFPGQNRQPSNCRGVIAFKHLTCQVYQQEGGKGFYLLVRQEPYLAHPSWWTVVDFLDQPRGHEIQLWREHGGTQSPTDPTINSAGGWYFNNATKNSGYIRSKVEGNITVKCIE